MKRAGRLLCGAALLAALGGAGWGAALLLEREASHRQRLRDLEADNVDLRAELTRQRSENDRLAAEAHRGMAERDALARRLAAAETTCEQLRADVRRQTDLRARAERALRLELAARTRAERETAAERARAEQLRAAREDGSPSLKELMELTDRAQKAASGKDDRASGR